MSYAHPEVLVSTDWVQEHLNDPKVRIVEVDYDPLANYQLGHIPGAVLFDWRRDLNHPLQRDILSKEQLEQLFSRSGISNDTPSTATSTTGSQPTPTGIYNSMASRMQYSSTADARNGSTRTNP